VSGIFIAAHRLKQSRPPAGSGYPSAKLLGACGPGQTITRETSPLAEAEPAMIVRYSASPMTQSGSRYDIP
jgi:hypothetical protein